MFEKLELDLKREGAKVRMVVEDERWSGKVRQSEWMLVDFEWSESKR
jgi:hypothetical protein